MKSPRIPPRKMGTLGWFSVGPSLGRRGSAYAKRERQLLLECGEVKENPWSVRGRSGAAGLMSANRGGVRLSPPAIELDFALSIDPY